MSVKHALLGILSERDRHGYELKSAFDERVGEFWGLNYGQIYITLDHLEREGLVERRNEPQNKRPERKIYHVTAEGRRELESWLVRPVARTRALRDELFIKLLFLFPRGEVDRPPARDRLGPALRLIRAQRQAYLDRMKRLMRRKLERSRGSRRDDFPVSDLLIDAALLHAEADVRWLGHAEQKLRGRRSRSPRGGGRADAGASSRARNRTSAARAVAPIPTGGIR
jgi:DNA-binding PadR family transcriptional regulator